MHRLWTALALTLCLWVALACGEDSDQRMVRRYADCMADTNTVLHREAVSNLVGSVPLSADMMEARLRAQLVRGKITMAWIRAGYARYCE